MERTATPDPLLAIRDRLAINDLLHAYCRHVDLLEVRELGQLFTDDCIVDYGPGLGGPHRGRDVLETALARGLRRFSATSHHLSNIEVDLDGDRAAAISYVLAWHRMANSSPDAVLYGQYHDHCVRAGSGWRISERRLLVVGEVGFPIAWNPIGRDTGTDVIGARPEDSDGPDASRRN
jgi:hypothetical protein